MLLFSQLSKDQDFVRFGEYSDWKKHHVAIFVFFVAVIVNSSLVPSLDNELQIQHILTGSIRNSTTNTPEE